MQRGGQCDAVRTPCRRRGPTRAARKATCRGRRRATTMQGRRARRLQAASRRGRPARCSQRSAGATAARGQRGRAEPRGAGDGGAATLRAERPRPAACSFCASSRPDRVAAESTGSLTREAHSGGLTARTPLEPGMAEGPAKGMGTSRGLIGSSRFGTSGPGVTAQIGLLY